MNNNCPHINTMRIDDFIECEDCMRQFELEEWYEYQRALQEDYWDTLSGGN